MLRILLISLVIGIAACAGTPPTPADQQAKRFESVPKKAVIYVVRTPMDSQEMGGLALEGAGQVMTYGGTYYRWEVDPGVRRVTGVGASNVSVTLNAESGRIYFLQYTVIGNMRSGPQNYRLASIGDAEGRTLVARSTLLP